jgi:carbon-monoxide dehydrogenase large subunit
MTNGWNAGGAARIGDPVVRKEDLRLLTGRGAFSDDLCLPGQLYAAMVRSPHAHAEIVGIDAAAARALPGVMAVLTGADTTADGLKSVPHGAILSGALDIPLVPETGQPYIARQPVLTTDRVRYVGEAVAMVIAETLAQARQAAENVDVTYAPLPHVVRAIHAADSSSPVLHPAAGGNVVLDASIGNATDTEAAFAAAAHRVSLRTWIQRVTGVPMEPRAAVATYDAATRCFTLEAGSGNVVRQKRELATILGVEETQVRVIARDVGGNFGTRNAFYPEFALIAWAAKRLGRPVKWTCERSEAFVSDYGGRDLEVEAELALDREGRFLALRSTNLSNVGAYSVSYGPLTKGCELMTSVYRVPAARVNGKAVLTNTVPTNSYRSSGRPEAMFVMERLIDRAAQALGMDRVELRRRNLIEESEQPYRNAMGLSYDNGAYGRVMTRALEHADWAGFEARRSAARARGRLRGIGVANYIEVASGIPRERAEVTVDASGFVEVVIGTLSSGQGHETSFAQLVTHVLGIPIGEVRLVQGDTARVKAGGGSHAGRSMRLAGVVIGTATAQVLDRARAIAALEFDVAPDGLDFAEGRFSPRGSNRSLSLYEIAALALNSPKLAPDARGPLMAVGDEVAKHAAFPFGSHVCEVEIDPETGTLEIVGYVAVDDVGRAVNPLILHGQAHGAITQGLGQALSEISMYDEASGQLLAGSFMDYAMPRAPGVPHYTTIISEIPATTNALGIRAGGEGGTTPALAVIVNAAVDALRDHGVTHLEMPLTSERIWRAIHATR